MKVVCLSLLCFAVVFSIADGGTTDIVMTEAESTDTTTTTTPVVTTPTPGVTTPSPGVTTPSPGVTTPSPGTPVPSTDRPEEATTLGGSGDPLERTDKIIIGVTCGVVGAAIIGGVSSALVNRRKAQQIAARENDQRGLAKNEVAAAEAGQS